jgi:hypothetical protein
MLKDLNAPQGARPVQKSHKRRGDAAAMKGTKMGSLALNFLKNAMIEGKRTFPDFANTR